MRRLALGLLAFALAACAGQAAEFWRPISEPNLLMPLKKAQSKLEFDLSQCNCGIFPLNVPPSDQTHFQPDKQRLVQTGVTVTKENSDSCIQRPSLVVAECMRARGWEITKCTGRMPIAGGGALCAAAMVDE